jgi:hypothetical protein
MADGSWRPRTHDLVASAKADRTNPATGRTRLRNGSSWFWGGLVAWALLAMAAVLLNKNALAGPDPMTPVEVALTACCLCLASVAAFVVLVRPFVELDSGNVLVRNPLRRHLVQAAKCRGVEDGWLGYPRLRLDTRAITLFALEEALSARIAGGSIDRAILEREIEDARTDSTPSPDERARWSLLDRGVVVLGLGWVLYAGSFLF